MAGDAILTAHLRAHHELGEGEEGGTVGGALLRLETLALRLKRPEQVGRSHPLGQHAIGALAVSACAYEGLEEAFLVGFTDSEVATLTEVLEELSADRAAATDSLLEVVPAVAEVHRNALAGIIEDQPVGFGMAWMAASVTPARA